MTYIYIYSYTSIHSYIYIFYTYNYLCVYICIYIEDWCKRCRYGDDWPHTRMWTYSDVWTYAETGGTSAVVGVTHVSNSVSWRMRTYDVWWRMLTYSETGGHSRRRRRDASVYADVCRRMLIYIYAVVCWHMTYADAWRMQKQEATTAGGGVTRVSCSGGREGRRGGSRGVGKTRASRVWRSWLFAPCQFALPLCLPLHACS
jgi:hypothetical protein